MEDLHHSDVLSYAISRIAAEYTRDQEALISELKVHTREANHRGLGTTQHRLPDDLLHKSSSSIANIEEEDAQAAFDETLPRA